MNTFIKSLVIPVVVLTFSQTTKAQKLPSEQKESLYAPVNVKIDGKATEWIGKFQATNDATLLTYVMSNDKDNLYLTLQANDLKTLNKIFFDGIALTIKPGKGRSTAPVKITYPLVQKADRSKIVTPLRDKSANADSIAAVINTALGQGAKTIGLAGFADIADPDISVYNDLGINAAVQIDATRTMTFEYKLPIKYIVHLIDKNSSFEYEIAVVGMAALAASRTEDAAPRRLADGTILVQGGPPTEFIYPTFLKSAYKLAKK